MAFNVLKCVLLLGLTVYTVTSTAQVNLQESGSAINPAPSTAQISLVAPVIVDTTPTPISAKLAKKARLDALVVLIKRRQYSKAYAFANPLVEEFEGIEIFDFNYALSCIETQHFDHALFAIERLVFGYPLQSRYRLELARTHFYLNNLIRAKIEFHKVLKQNPPLSVQKNVQLFLDRISELQNTTQPSFMIALDFSSGFDSNINSATNEKSLPLNLDGIKFTVPLDSSARETASSYWSTLLNMSYVAPLTRTSAFDIRSVLSKRKNTQLALYNLDILMAEGGYNLVMGAARFRGAARYQNIFLNGDAFLSATGISGQANLQAKNGYIFNVTLDYGLNSYNANSDGDINTTRLNFGFSSPPQKSSWSLMFAFGEDKADKKSNDANAKHLQGFSYQNTTVWGQRRSHYWLLSLFNSEYNAINPIYNKLRKDTALTAGIGFRYTLSSHLNFRNDYVANYTDSTLVANTFERFKVEFGMTYRF